MRLLRNADLDEVSSLRDRGELFWLDLDDPDRDTLERVGRQLDLHRLAVEDTQEFGQRPKLEPYEHEVLLVYYGAARGSNGEPVGIEVHLHVSEHFVLTVHRAPCHRLRAVADRYQGDRASNPGALVYRIVDALTDSILDVLDAVSHAVEEYETAVVKRPRARDRDRMAMLHRGLQGFRRTIGIQRQMFDRIPERLAELPGLDPDLSTYYRDVGDHLWHAVDDADAARDTLQGTLATYSNEVQERLTIVATIFLPLTVVTGFFGQNFNWMINHIGSGPAFWGLGIGGMLVSVLTILGWLARSGLWQWPGGG